MARVSDLKSCLMWEINRPYYTAERQSPYFRLFGEELRITLTLTFNNSSECSCYVKLRSRSSKKMTEMVVSATCHLIAGRLGFGGSEQVTVRNSGDTILKCIMPLQELDSPLVGSQSWKIYCHFTCGVEPLSLQINNGTITLLTGPSPTVSRPKCPDVGSQQVPPEPEERQETEELELNFKKMNREPTANRVCHDFEPVTTARRQNLKSKNDAARQKIEKDVGNPQAVILLTGPSPTVSRPKCPYVGNQQFSPEPEECQETEALGLNFKKMNREPRANRVCHDFEPVTTIPSATTARRQNLKSKNDAARQKIEKDVGNPQAGEISTKLRAVSQPSQIHFRPAIRRMIYKVVCWFHFFLHTIMNLVVLLTGSSPTISRPECPGDGSQQVSGYESLNFDQNSAAKVESKCDTERENLYGELSLSQEVSGNECLNFASSAANVKLKPDAERENFYEELSLSREVSDHERLNLASSAANIQSEPDAERENLYEELSLSQEISVYEFLNFYQNSAAKVELKCDAERENFYEELSLSRQVSGNECLNFASSEAKLESKPNTEWENFYEELSLSQQDCTEPENHKIKEIKRENKGWKKEERLRELDEGQRDSEESGREIEKSLREEKERSEREEREKEERERRERERKEKEDRERKEKEDRERKEKERREREMKEKEERERREKERREREMREKEERERREKERREREMREKEEREGREKERRKRERREKEERERREKEEINTEKKRKTKILLTG